MNLKSILAALFILVSISIIADKTESVPEVSDKGEKVSSEKTFYTSTIQNWSIFQFVLFPGVPGSTYNSAVYGMKVGLPMSGGKGCVGGLEMSLVSNTTARVYGVQMSPFVNASDETDGLQMCAITNATNEMSGWQMSMINYSKNMYGVQMGLANIDTESVNGWQTGIFNYTQKVYGLQLGVVNIASKSGVQFGLINIIKNGWIPFLPLINISF